VLISVLDPEIQSVKIEHVQYVSHRHRQAKITKILIALPVEYFDYRRTLL